MEESKRWDHNFLNVKPSTGLEVDGHIFTQILKPYSTKIEHRAWVDIFPKKGSSKFIRLFLEHIHKDEMAFRNWFMVNQELLEPNDLYFMRDMELIICKTEFSYKLVKDYVEKHDYQCAIILLGFTSIIRPLSTKHQMNYNQALHLAGASWMKGTKNVLLAWNKHPEWPPITILCRQYCWDDVRSTAAKLKRSKRGLGANITLLSELVSFDKVLGLLETCGIQILTSESEGWGHYIHEARAHQALCVYTDYPPMNEFFDHTSGIGVRKGKNVKMHGKLPGADGFSVSVEGIEDAMNKVSNLPYAAREKMGKHAAEQFYKERVAFLKKSQELRDLV